MARGDDHSPRARRDAAADLSGVDLILECGRAASRRNPRKLDPKRATPYRPFHPHDGEDKLQPRTIYEVDGVKLVETRGQSYWRIIGTPREVLRTDLFSSAAPAASASGGAS